MTRDDRLALLGDEVQGGTWADLGAGTGVFTLALAERVGPGGRIYAVDQDQRALRELRDTLNEMTRGADRIGPEIETLTADFAGHLPLRDLDGILLANSLHFQKDACAVLRRLRRLVKPGGRVLVVEYDVQRRSPWVPFPLPAALFGTVAECAGLVRPRLIAERPSAYHGHAYSAVAENPPSDEGPASASDQLR